MMICFMLDSTINEPGERRLTPFRVMLPRRFPDIRSTFLFESYIGANLFG